MKVRLFSILIIASLLLAVLVSCTGSPELKHDVSVSFSGMSRSVTSATETLNKDVLFWKYAARKLLTEAEENDGQTPTYDEEGAEFIHEDTPGLDGKVDGFSEGHWDFLLFGYRRSGEEGSYTYSLVWCGESKGNTLVEDAENMVDVKVGPVTDHGNGTLFVNADDIHFAPAGEIDNDSELEMSFTVRSVPGDVEQTGEGGLFNLEPGLYRVDVKYTVDEYTYAHGAVIATVYSNQTTTVSGTVDELKTFAGISIPDEG